MEPSAYGCFYRGADGCMCAIGYLLANDDYDPTMEGKAVAVVGLNVPSIFPTDLNEEGGLNLLYALQSVHDEGLNWGAEGFQPTTDTLNELAGHLGVDVDVVAAWARGEE